MSLKQTKQMAMLLGLSIGIAGGLFGCQNLPKTPHLPKSLALEQKLVQKQATPTNTSPLSSIIPQAHRTDNRSGYHLLATGKSAFEARRILTRLAAQSIDVQYYIWHDDEAGQRLLNELKQAADKGVVVRLLLDDFNVKPSLEQKLLALAHHPNIAVRLINPNAYRDFRAMGYVLNPIRSNRRMHNKSMIFDNYVGIIGGRNVGNEYLNSHHHNQFADLDILLAGKVVKDIRTSFDDYWHSPLAFDVETLVKNRPNPPQTPTNSKNLDINSDGHFDHQKATFAWADMTFISDRADKLQGKTRHQDHLVSLLQNELGTPKHSLSIISSYFVPTKDGVATLVKLAKNGIKINILTNAYDASDVGSVHAGYAHWRKDLLKAGVRLYELKSTNANNQNNPNSIDKRLGRRPDNRTSLHAKTFAVDDDKVFIGSYNLDPRSANINTEMGVIIHDQQLTQRLHQSFDDRLLAQAYEVKLHNNQLQWHTLDNGENKIYTTEPKMQNSDKVIIFLMSLMPIDWLL